MTLDEAMGHIRQACEAVSGNWHTHKTLQMALDTVTARLKATADKPVNPKIDETAVKPSPEQSSDKAARS